MNADLRPRSVGKLQSALQGGEIFRLLVDGARDYAIFMLDAEGYVASWNEGAQRIKGYAANEIIGQHFSKFYAPPALAAGWPQEELRRAGELGRFEDEDWRVRKDGSRFWANVVITAVRGSDGELRGFSKITRDLTERRAHEEQLRQSEETLRLLVEGVKDHAIFMLGTDGTVAQWNAGAERVLGYTASDVVGRPPEFLYTAEDIAAGKPQASIVMARESAFFTDVGWRVKRDGLRFWADVTITALRQPDGTQRGFAQVVRDLSDRQRVEELETEGQRINEFIAMLAHELRNPLAPIGNAVGVMQKLAASPEQAWCTQLIGRQVSHLSRLVDDLLDVSRITSGKIRLQKEVIDLVGVVASAVDTMRPMVAGYGHEFKVELPDAPVHIEGEFSGPIELAQ